MRFNGANSYLFVNDTEIQKCITKDSEINVIQLLSGNISKDVSVDNIKKKMHMSMILVLVMMLLLSMIY